MSLRQPKNLFASDQDKREAFLYANELFLQQDHPDSCGRATKRTIGACLRIAAEEYAVYVKDVKRAGELV